MLPKRWRKRWTRPTGAIYNPVVGMGLAASDNDLDETLTPEMTAVLEREDCDVQFINKKIPAFHHRRSGEWTATGWHNGQPCVTFSARSFEAVAAMHQRHEAGDTSLCGEGLPQTAASLSAAPREATRARRQAVEGAAWRELNQMAMAGDAGAVAEVAMRAGVEAGMPTPIYDSLLDKHWQEAGVTAA